MKKKSENRLKAAALGTDGVKAATLRKEKMQNIKAAALKATGVKAAAREYVSKSVDIKAATLIDEGRGARAEKELSRFKTLQPTYQKTFSIKDLLMTNLRSLLFIFLYSFWESSKGGVEEKEEPSLREDSSCFSFTYSFLFSISFVMNSFIVFYIMVFLVFIME